MISYYSVTRIKDLILCRYDTISLQINSYFLYRYFGEFIPITKTLLQSLLSIWNKWPVRRRQKNKTSGCLCQTNVNLIALAIKLGSKPLLTY